MRGNGSGVGIRVKEEHDAIHSIAREFGELGQGVEDVLLLFLRGRVRGRGLWRRHGTGWVDGVKEGRSRWSGGF